MYVGITCQVPKDRWASGYGYRNCPFFYRAIKKYGWHSFDHEIFASHLTKEEAENMEKILIAKLQTQNPEFGYNLAEGGSATFKGIPRTEEVKRKISETLTGRHLSEEHKKKVSEFMKGRFKGRPRPKGSGRPAKPILCVETGEVFESIAGAAREKGIGNKNRISAAAKGTAITVGGYHWQYYTSSIS